MREIELINKRKPREKHFLQEDGTIVAKVYSDDVHYLKNGKYEEIDNTLKKENDCYTNKSNDYKVKFKEDGKDSLMRMTKDDNYIDIKLKNANDTKIRKMKSTSKLVENVAYENVVEDVSIEYKALPTKVKETMILKNSNQTEFTFTIDTNLILEKCDNYIIAKKENKTIFTIDSPYMEDSKGELNHNVDYNLIETLNGYELCLSLDKEWLELETTKYPVYVDPTITNQSQAGGMQDTYIYPGDTGVNRNSHSVLKAGVERINGVDRVNRTLVKFDLPTIGTGSEIVDAYILFTGYVTNDTGEEKRKLATVHRITEQWSENNATWNEMHDKFDSKVEAVIDCVRSRIRGTEILPGFSVAGITHLVKKWYKDIPNYGVLIKSANETYEDNENYPAFFSKETDITGTNPRPVLEIIYRNQNGLENYLDYRKQLISNGVIYNNTFNGNLIGTFEIGKTIGGVMPVLLQLVYNTNDVVLNKNIGNGLGYQFNLNQTIRSVKIDTVDYLEYVDGDGTIHYFLKDTIKNDGLYYDEDGLSLTIEQTDTICILTDKDGGKSKFIKSNGNTYYLTRIEDSNKNYIQITLDANNRITKVIDKNNAEVLIEYNENNIKITSPDDIVNLNYANETLISIVSNQGTIIITNNEKNLISSITDITGMKYVYEYYENKPYKIKKVDHYGLDNEKGKSFTLEYGFNSTSIIDNQGRCETLMFSNYGNIVSTNTLYSTVDINDAYSLTQNYGVPNFNPNKVLSSACPVRYIKNYLRNTSFEDDRDNFLLAGENSEQLTKQFSTDYSFSGNRSLKVTSTTAGQSIMQQVEVPKGKSYTFSGYFKNNESVNLSLSYVDTEGNSIVSTQKIDCSDIFEREDVTIYYSENADTTLTITLEFLGMNILYMDDIQLEEGEIANNYNFIENSDFSEGFSDWELEAYDEKSSKVDATQFFKCIKFNNNKNTALKVSMNPLYATSFRKRFEIKGKVGELFTLSFWYKSEGVSPCRQYAGNYVQIFFHPIDDNQPGHCIFTSTNFDANDEKWQYYSFRQRSLEEFDYIDIVFVQNTEANDFYITNLALYKEVTSGDFNYDNNGNLVSLETQSQEKSKFNYNSKNQLISATSPVGKNFKYEYYNDNPSCILNAISDSGIITETEYDAYGNPIFTRTSKKIPEELIDGIYRIRSSGTKKYLKAKYRDILMETNQCSNTLWKIEKSGDKYKIIYSVLPNYSLSYDNNKLRLTGIDKNNLFEIEQNENGSYCIFIREGDIKKYLKVIDSNIELADRIENSAEYEFYIEIGDNVFLENSAKYTEDGKFLTSLTDINQTKTLYETDPTTGLLTSITDANNNVLSYQYDEKKRLSSIQKGDKRVDYSYNNMNLLSKIDVGNKEYNILYDNFLNLKSLKINDVITLFKNNYAINNGNLSSKTYGNGDNIYYEYDNFDRISKIIKSDDVYHIKYNNSGNISKILSNETIEKVDYDVAGRLYSYSNDIFKFNYTYDSDNNIIKKQYQFDGSNEMIENTFGKDGVVNEINLGNRNITYIRDSLLRTLTKNINNQYQITYDYINYGKKATTLIKSIKNGNEEYSYEYDNLRNITSIYHNSQLIKSYSYNQYNELALEEDHYLNTQIEYQYDLFGNLLSKTTKSTSNWEIINVDTYEYGNQNWKDQLTKYNDDTIIYDDIGNPISIGHFISLNWKNGRELSSYEDVSNNLKLSFKYNESGIRTRKIVNGIETKYYLEGTNIIYQKTGNDSIYFIRDEDGLLGFKYKNNLYYYQKNVQNDIIGIVDSDYNTIVKYKYDSWGNMSITDYSTNNLGIINPYRYRSYYYDEEMRLYYLNNRYYNPEWGRFLNADSMIGLNGTHNSYNLYMYADNNPINNDDTNGNFFKKLAKKIGHVIKKAKKVVSKVVKKVKKVVSTAVKYVADLAVKAVDTLYNWSTAVNNSFTVDAQVGFDPVRQQTALVHSKTMGVNISNCDMRQYTSTSTGVNFGKKGAGFSFSNETRNYDSGAGNPMATVKEMKGQDTTETDINVDFALRFLVASKPVESDYMFIGLNFDLGENLPLIFSFRVGFNIKVS